ncbi:hypothetical protein DE146DRAFT_602960 [Phaeosphaeria sp. MPI-PUGE-AT-0046c]|nr:hypothetical protein DE146DRAFT_602960 [Phaeosphaeria sp. MPI-PUGE-AT-0046c]
MPNTERRFVLVEGAVSSYNIGNKRSSTAPPVPSSPLPTIDLSRGDLAPARHHFTPILALAKYPYKFCNPSHSQDIASAFFDAGKFWKREWDLYYVWDIESVTPLILVRESQSQDLLKEINKHLKLRLKITDSQREEGLVCHFPDHPACLPRYLGRSNSRDQYDNMVQNTPDRGFRAADETPHGPLDSGTLDDFKQMMEDLWDVQKHKNKAKKAKQQQDRLGRQMAMVHQLKRAQRYLGLRASDIDGQTASGLSPQPIDPLASPRTPFDHSVVFICVDVESYERAHHKITEIGLATLDTKDLISTAPGSDGEAWRKLIKARHFRIKEHRHLVNLEFVQGHPDGFEFGESTLVSLKDAPAHVAACFQPPFGMHASNTAEAELIKISLQELHPNEKRKLVLLGHDTLGDIRYLQQLGYDPVRVENIIETMDTAKMYQAWRRDSQPTSLGRIMNDFDVAAWKLHNAGNDAVYTVQAMLAICVREATVRGSPELQSMRERDTVARIAAASDNAVQRAIEDADSWTASESPGDGGAPIPLQAPAV